MKMVGITIEFVREFLSKNNIELKATQEKISMPVLIRIFKKMKGGIQFSPICVKDGFICDGHHRYLASLLSGHKISTVPGESTSATIIVPWESVSFLDTDYDTVSGIDALNHEDAEYNNLAIEHVLELLK